MKPAWDELGDQFINSKTILIGDVDCIQEESLCQKHGVTGYPTIKYFTSETAADGCVAEHGRYASFGPLPHHLCGCTPLVVMYTKAPVISRDCWPLWTII